MTEQVGSPGRYDDVAELVLGKTKARLVAVLVLDGDKGSGFSASGHGGMALAAASGELAWMLRELADSIEQSSPDGVRITRGRG